MRLRIAVIIITICSGTAQADCLQKQNCVPVMPYDRPAHAKCDGDPPSSGWICDGHDWQPPFKTETVDNFESINKRLDKIECMIARLTWVSRIPIHGALADDDVTTKDPPECNGQNAH